MNTIIVKLQCQQVECVHNLLYCCNLKTLLINKDGRCSQIQIKKEDKSVHNKQ